MPFNIKQADNQAAQLRNPGVTPATNNRMVQPPAPVSAVPPAPAISAVPIPPATVGQATPVAGPPVANAGIAPGGVAPVQDRNVPMTPQVAANIGAGMRRNGADGIQSAGPINPLVRNKRIV